MMSEGWLLAESGDKLRELLAEAERERLARLAGKPSRPARVVLASALRAIAGRLDAEPRPAAVQRGHVEAAAHRPACYWPARTPAAPAAPWGTDEVRVAGRPAR